MFELDVDGVLRRAKDIRGELATEVDDNDPMRSSTAKQRLWRQYQKVIAPLAEVADAVIAAGLRLGGKLGKALNIAYEQLKLLSWSGELGEVEFGLVPVCEPDNHAGVPAHGFKVGVESGQEQVMWLFHSADGCLSYAHPLGELDLGQFSGARQRRQAHRVGTVGLFHVAANLGDTLGQVGPLSKLAYAVVAADESNLFSHWSPFWRSQASTSASPRAAALA